MPSASSAIPGLIADHAGIVDALEHVLHRLRQALKAKDEKTRDKKWAHGLEWIHALLDAVDEADDAPDNEVLDPDEDPAWLVPDRGQPVPKDLLDPQVLIDAIRAEGLKARQTGNQFRVRATAGLLATLRRGPLAVVACGLVDQMEDVIRLDDEA